MPSDRRVYLDYNATAPMRPEALDAYRRAAAAAHGNASSTHRPGVAAKEILDESRRGVAAALGVRPREVVFTSGGTEGDNLALKGVALARGRGRIVTSAVEHPAVVESCRWLAGRGFEVVTVPVDGNGVVAPQDVEAAITGDTVLVSVMWVNNETGVIQPIEAIAAAVRARGVVFHTDAVQAFGRIAVDLSAVPVDLLTLSAHKFGGPQGAGVLVVRRGVELEALLHGGGQEASRRSGTYNVPAAAAAAEAVRLARAELGTEAPRLRALRDRLEGGVLERIPRAHVNGAGAERVANTSNVRFDGAAGEAVLIGLDAAGIAASSASACAASRHEPSDVLMAMGLTRAEAEDSMRFSMGRLTSEDDITRFLAVIPGVIERVRSVHTL